MEISQDHTSLAGVEPITILLTTRQIRALYVKDAGADNAVVIYAAGRDSWLILPPVGRRWDEAV